MSDLVAGLTMSLDDIIASKKSEGGERGRGRGGFMGRGGGDWGGGRFGSTGRGGHLGARPMNALGGGIAKMSSLPANVRVIIPAANTNQQQPQGFEGSELRVTNLVFKVTEADVRELFSAIGRLRRTAIDRKPNGESAGAASVAFYNAADCDRAIKTYDGVALDGRPMRVVKVGAGGGVRALSSGLQLGGPRSRRVVIADGSAAGGGGGGGGGSRVVSVMRTTNTGGGGGGGIGGSRGGFNSRGGRGGGGRGGGRVRANVTKIDAAELDAQLDTYMKGG